MKQRIETDYLIIGAGAMGLAFADQIVMGSRDKRVVLVDERAKPGGHWNDAYAFVRLHQPALFYGVNSEPLGSGEAEDLVSRDEILAYDERVLQKLQATGRCTFLGRCRYEPDGRIVSTVAPEREIDVVVKDTLVDAAYMNVTVPATRKPEYAVSADVTCVPINGIAQAGKPWSKPWSRYCVIGAGKTGMDAVLYLLDQGVAPERVQWVMPNDAWLLNRVDLMPENMAKGTVEQNRAIAAAETLDEVYLAMERAGNLLRMDAQVWPTKFRCATVTLGEVEALRSVKNILRQGRVVRIEKTELVLEAGTQPAEPDTLYVDCTADGLAKRPKRPIYEGGGNESGGAGSPARITIQPIFMCQQVFSAAALAALDLRREDPDEKNEILHPIPHPERPPELVEGLWESTQNLTRLGRALPGWLLRTRLLPTAHVGWPTLLRMLWDQARTAPGEQKIQALLATKDPS